MKKITLFAILLFLSAAVQAQTDFRNDRVLYNNLYPAELVEFLRTNPEALLIDVRTPGEYSDTSRFGSLNIGHLKGAINIEIDSIESRLNEIKDHTDKPVVLYCSHSQRSRRVSKYLSDNGFKKVYNLNGGMSWMTQAEESEFPGKKEMIIFSAPHKNISVSELAGFIADTKDVLIIDVRSEAEFYGKDTSEGNNLGKLKNAVHIPSDELKNNLARIQQYKENNILVYDINGALSTHTAKYLTENGFTKVHNLIGGISAVHREGKTGAKQSILENKPAYNILNVYETLGLLKSGSNLVILDVRPADEYNNKADMEWHNLGRMKNSINIPPEKFAGEVMNKVKDKKSKILIYGMGDFPAKASKILTDAGYENVNLLYGGLWSMVSVYANVKGYSFIKDYMENYEGMY